LCKSCLCILTILLAAHAWFADWMCRTLCDLRASARVPTFASENVQMRRQSGLPELSRAEALAPAGTPVAAVLRPAAIVPATILSAETPAAAPAEATVAVLPTTPPDTARLAQPSPPVSPTAPALQRESAESGSSALRPSPAKRPRHGVGDSPHAPPRKNESAAPALPSKQVCTEPIPSG